MLRSRRYVILLRARRDARRADRRRGVLVPRRSIDDLQTWVFSDVPDRLGFDGEPTWWPSRAAASSPGSSSAQSSATCPGRGGHSPADGFKTGAPPTPIELPGVFLAAVISLGLGAVIGPEAPLIALGGGIAALVVRLVKRDAPRKRSWSSAAPAASPPSLPCWAHRCSARSCSWRRSASAAPPPRMVLLPGLLAAGIGALVFIGIGDAPGVGDLLAGRPEPARRSTIPTPPSSAGRWSSGVPAAVVGTAIRMLGAVPSAPTSNVAFCSSPLSPASSSPLLAIALRRSRPTRASADVLFSGQTALPGLIDQSASYTVGALLLLIAVQGPRLRRLAQQLPGGPVFPAMYIGAAGGIAMSHLPGMSLVARRRHGHRRHDRGAPPPPAHRRCCWPRSLLGTDGLGAMPVVIVAVVVAFVVSAWFVPQPAAVERGRGRHCLRRNRRRAARASQA